MQILFCLHNYKTDEFLPTVCYIVPTNSLIEQVKQDLKQDFKGFELNIETALPYYEIEDFIVQDGNILILCGGVTSSRNIAVKIKDYFVNEGKLSDIAKDIRRDNQTINNSMELCNKYLNSQMKSYMPWEINIY